MGQIVLATRGWYSVFFIKKYFSFCQNSCLNQNLAKIYLSRQMKQKNLNVTISFSIIKIATLNDEMHGPIFDFSFPPCGDFRFLCICSGQLLYAQWQDNFKIE
jgi:hypothetical protein